VDSEPSGDVGDTKALAGRVAVRLKGALGVSVRVQVAAAGTLPRFEMKARRFVVEA
jgi:phenylacetate-coenzyme A ligase PaaK-like adenylate-forming protein